MKSCAYGLAAALAFASAAAVGADVYKCVDRDGHVTFTDAPCGGNVVLTQVQAPAAQQADGAQAAGAEDGVTLAPDEAQISGSGERLHGASLGIAARDVRSPWASLPRPVAKRTVSLDAATLQAARSTMAMQDSLRRQMASR